jgi:hypothetical protein
MLSLVRVSSKVAKYGSENARFASLPSADLPKPRKNLMKIYAKSCKMIYF